MGGSSSHRVRAKRLASAAIRVVLASAIVLSTIHLAQHVVIESMVPSFAATVQGIDDRFVIEDARLAVNSRSEAVRFRANLARPVRIAGREAYPFGWNGGPRGGIQVTYTVGGTLAYCVLMLIIVVAWPAGSALEVACRLLIVIVFSAAYVLLSVSTTTIAELWNSVYDRLQIHQLCWWMVWSRLLMGGGGFVIAMLLAAAAVRIARLPFEQHVRWLSLSRSRFEAFLRAYERPYTVDPPWGRLVRTRVVRDSALGAGHSNIIARCRHSGRPTLYQVRADLYVRQEI